MTGKRTAYVGRMDEGAGEPDAPYPQRFTVTVELREREGGELSVVGWTTECTRRDGKGGRWQEVGGGQNRDDLAAVLVPADGWTMEAIAGLRNVWERWHLNGMRAGCAHQRAAGWADRPIDPAKPTNAYGFHFHGQRSASWNMLAWVTRKEHPKGLLSEPCPECGYRYGSAWLHEELPPEVLAAVSAFIESGDPSGFEAFAEVLA